MVQSDTVFEVADDVFDHGMAAVVGFQLDGVAGAVGDQRVVGVVDQQLELGAWGGFDPAHDQADLWRFGAERPVDGFGDIGAVDEVWDRRPFVVADRGDRFVDGFVQLDGDRERDSGLAAGRSDRARVESRRPCPVGGRGPR